MESSDKGTYNPLDPFAEKEEIFEATDIRRSKSRSGRRKNSNKPETSKEKSKKQSFRAFLKELPTRADKKKYYTYFLIALVSLLGIVTAIIFVIAPWQKEQAKTAEETKAIEMRNEIDVLLSDSGEETEDVKVYKTEELERLFDESFNNPEAQYEYAAALINLYESDSNVRAIDNLAEKFLDNQNLTFPTNAYFLTDLQSAYFLLGESDKYVETIEKILALPDNDEYDFNAESFTIFKQKLRTQLESYNQESSE